MFKKIISITVIFTFMISLRTSAAGIDALTSKSAVLMEADTGTVLYRLNENLSMPPASITKIMTMLIIMEELSEGNITYDDIVTGSERAKSMGGSTIFLDAGEKMSVRDLLKGICVASANDACVAMAEYISGTEEAFVNRMNDTAKRLGMENTHFVNTNGLDSEGHVASAIDIAKMSRELMKYKDIFNFTTIWTDSLRDGAFDLANTNKLIRFYEGATGLKTGSTDGAGCCISATAERNGLGLIAVVMNAPTSADRFSDARTLLDYGFSNFAVWKNEDMKTPLGRVLVSKGKKENVDVVLSAPVKALLSTTDLKNAELKVVLEEEVSAPVKKGQKLGEASCVAGGKEVTKVDVVAAQDVPSLNLGMAYMKLFKSIFIK